MKRKINEIIDQLGVNIEEHAGLDADGHYIAMINTIVLDAQLAGLKRTLVLLHELGHACLHHNNHELYNLTASMHCKMETEADLFMINRIMERRFNDSDFDPDSFNYMNFLESYELNPNYESVVKELVKSYYLRTNIV